jgi:sarcosine oxidase
VLGWVWPKRPERFELGTLPVWLIDHPDGTSHYGFPMLPDNPGFKLAHHRRTAPTDPDSIFRDVNDDDEETIRPLLRQFIPDADGPLLSLRVCMYTNTPDLHFIVDIHPQYPNVTLACGFSGHGFKFAPVIGQVLADLATVGKTSLPIRFLALDRFNKGGAQASSRGGSMGS